MEQLSRELDRKNDILCKFMDLSDSNWTQTHNHLVHKRTLNHLAKLATNLIK